jgi:hypothetical protein
MTSKQKLPTMRCSATSDPTSTNNAILIKHPDFTPRTRSLRTRLERSNLRIHVYLNVASYTALTYIGRMAFTTHTHIPTSLFGSSMHSVDSLLCTIPTFTRFSLSVVRTSTQMRLCCVLSIGER